ncbi:gamma carbonic anhydrase family protein [Aureimonas leprariae]|uniref:Gamma carbonic anhydrase family protein n=1 Tax=Plantimonas leprariae TaxID=2615207 RepID=A0A7V7PPL4_9HYPH|nr:gamma carbonic anhydrase family protein [Aureimonas leprariae]KAB0679916.1 gamma carbonic anhydrase family protein [Aureimonas leprariae]
MAVYALDDDRPELPSPGECFVAEGARVIGRVRLGPGIGIWFGAVVRGDNEWIEIGPDTNIQDNAVLHSDFGSPLSIGAGCTIGHGAIVHGCTIGDNSLVGMGATVLNGARIGENSIIGAGALVTEGKTFPAGSLIVGVPAKLIRPLEDEAIEGLRASARHYAENARRFAAGLTRIDRA